MRWFRDLVLRSSASISWLTSSGFMKRHYSGRNSLSSMVSACRLQTLHCLMQTPHCRQHFAFCRRQRPLCRRQNGLCRVQVAFCRLQNPFCIVQSAFCRRQNTHCRRHYPLCSRQNRHCKRFSDKKTRSPYLQPSPIAAIPIISTRPASECVMLAPDFFPDNPPLPSLLSRLDDSFTADSYFFSRRKKRGRVWGCLRQFVGNLPAGVDERRRDSARDADDDGARNHR